VSNRSRSRPLSAARRFDLLAPELPGVDPGDLRMIVRNLPLPTARRAVFIARRKDGRYVF